jgi:hypothetical protein
MQSNAFCGALLPILVTGCVFGSTASKYPMAYQPNGSSVQIRTLSDRELSGELLAVSDTAMTIVSVNTDTTQRVTNRITLVPFRSVNRARFSLASSATYRRGNLPQTQRLKNISRYPQGISPVLMTRLLEAYGQSTLDVVRP